MSDEPAAPSSVPGAPLAPRHIKTYPWKLCIARFVVRLVVGAVILTILFSVALIRALPYGSSGDGLAGVIVAGIVLFPLWALCGFVPPRGKWERTISRGRLAAYLAPVMLALVLGAAGLVKLVRSGDAERKTLGEAREAGIRVCTNELKQISEPVSADSLLIESGVVEENMLRDLLGSRGLKFVELRARSGQDWRTKEKTYGVDATRGDQTSHFAVAPDVKIVRVALARKGDAACTTRQVLGLEEFMGRVPTAPDACLRVDLDQQSRASHALKALPAGAGARAAFIKWSLVEQATGKVLVALTSSDTALRPSRQDGGADDERKAVGDDIVRCRSPHFSLMKLVYGPPRTPDERLSLGIRQVTLDIDAAEPDNPGSWQAVNVPEEEVNDWEARESARQGPAWKPAFRIAEQSGWAGYERGVIDFKAGVIAKPRLPVGQSQRTIERGSQRGFMVAWPSGPNSVALAQFGLDGRLLWKRQIASSLPVQEPRARFGLVGMEWDPREVRLYGFRRIVDGQEVAVRVLKVRLRAEDGLPRGRSSAEKR